MSTVEDLYIQRERVLALGASQLLDRSADEGEPLFVFADPAGHPFCIFVCAAVMRRQNVRAGGLCPASPVGILLYAEPTGTGVAGPG